MKKRHKLIISSILILVIIIVSSLFIKRYFLGQIKTRLGKSISYSQISLNFFPPRLSIDKPKVVRPNIFFSAEKVVIVLPFKSLILKEKPLEIFVDRPVLKFLTDKGGKGKGNFSLPFPFLIKKGIIHQGNISIRNRKYKLISQKANAIFTQKGDRFFLRLQSGKNIFSLPEKNLLLTGELRVLLKGKGKKVKIKNIKFFGTDYWVNIKGDIEDVLEPKFKLETSIMTEASRLNNLLSLPFLLKGPLESEGQLEKSNKFVSYQGSIHSKNLIFNQSNLGQTEGTISFLQNIKTELDLNFKKENRKKEYLKLTIDQEGIKGKFSQFHLNPIVEWLSLGWPVYSPAWGEFTIKNKRLYAQFEFRESLLVLKNNEFPLFGKLAIEWDGKKLVRISSSQLRSSFANFELAGLLKIDQNLDINIESHVENLEQTRQFVSLFLKQPISLSQINGQGEAKIRIYGEFSQPKIISYFTLTPAQVLSFNFSRVDGEITYSNQELLGEFDIKDEFFKGIVSANHGINGLDLNINMSEGEVDQIFSSLEISFPIKGKASGNLFIKQKKDLLRIEGEFLSSKLSVFNQLLTNVKGKIKWENGNISFPYLEFNLKEGTIKGKTTVLPQEREFEVDIKGEEFNISSFFSKIQGNLAFKLIGKGKFGQDVVLGKYEISDFSHPSFRKGRIKGNIQAGVIEENINLEAKGNIYPGQNDFFAQFIFPLKSKSLIGKIEGEIDNLNLIIPWKGVQGLINFIVEISGSLKSPEVKAIIDFKGKTLPIPKFAHAFNDFSGLIIFEKNSAQLLSFSAFLGGGKISGFGKASLDKSGNIDELNIQLSGKKMLLSPMERTRALCDGSLSLIKDKKNLTLKGEFFAHKLLWRREIEEKITFFSSPYQETESKFSLFDNLNIDLHLKAEKDCWIENSLGRVEGKFDLRILGNINSPSLLGEIIARRGELFFQDRSFNLLEGKVSFFNPLTPSDPYINFKGETFIKDYRVLFSLDGLLSRLNPELSSSPPLPPEDVLALLTLGEAFKRTYSYDRSTQLSTTSLLSFKLTEDVKKRAQQLFGIDRFRLDPSLMSSTAETTARLTLGKKVTKGLTIIYSTNLSTHRDDLIFLEWELAKDISVVGIRDEEGRFGLDVKIHKRF
ncbi:MAG: translocation/assembly module TamB domain-containing protein [Candidatus Aminicenantia bacterium]